MSNKKADKKSAMDNAHDPLSWLMQDTPDGGTGSEEVNKKPQKQEQIADEESNNTTSIQKEEENKFMEEVLSTAGDSSESVIEDKADMHSNVDDIDEGENIAMQTETMEETGAVEKGVTEVIDDANSSDEEKLVLDEDISIIRVAQLKENWLPFIDSTKNITIDASQVEDIDTAGLQLLLSFVKTVKSTGREVYWDSPSETLSVAVKETALKEVMGLAM